MTGQVETHLENTLPLVHTGSVTATSVPVVGGASVLPKRGCFSVAM